MPNFAYAYAAQVVEVEVDTETGFARLARVVAADDVGTAINPQMVEGQIEGAVVQAQGPPVVESIIVEVPDPRGPWGARGVGELPFLPLAPAVLAGIHDATGVWLNELPATPVRVLAALKAQGG